MLLGTDIEWPHTGLGWFSGKKQDNSADWSPPEIPTPGLDHAQGYWNMDKDKTETGDRMDGSSEGKRGVFLDGFNRKHLDQHSGSCWFFPEVIVFLGSVIRKVVSLEVKVVPDAVRVSIVNYWALKGHFTPERCTRQKITVSDHRIRCKCQPNNTPSHTFVYLAHLTPYLQQPILINDIRLWWMRSRGTHWRSDLNQIKRPPDRWKSTSTHSSLASAYFEEHHVVFFFRVFFVGVSVHIGFYL